MTKSPLQLWHIYTALALLSYMAGATPFTMLFTCIAIVAALMRLGDRMG